MPTYQEKSLLYNDLAVLEDAGVDLLKALKITKANSYQEVLNEIQEQIHKKGDKLSDCMKLRPKYFSRLDYELIALGEKAGKLSLSFKNLSQWYSLLNRTKSEVKSSLIYPALIFHLAPVLLSLPNLVSKGCFSCFLTNIAIFLSPIYLIIFCWKYLLPKLKSQHSILKLIDSLIMKIPIIGQAIYNLHLARFVKVLSYGLDSGLDMFESLNIAQRVCTNQIIKEKIQGIGILIKNGKTLTDSLSIELKGDELLRGLIQVGELSGKQVSMLDKLNEYYFDSFKTSLTRLSKVVPVVIFMILAVFIGIQIINSYSNIWSQIE